MGLPRSNRSHLSREESLSESVIRKRNSNVRSLSQPVPSTSSRHTEPSVAQKKRYSQQDTSPDRMIVEEEKQLAKSLIRYLLALDKGKQVINKTRIVKNVFGGQGKHFHRAMTKAKGLLSKIFGYRLVELEGNKYIMVNEIENSFPHIHPREAEGSRQALLFIALTHIFMHEESCSEDALWDFLTHLGIQCSDTRCDSYFGNVKQQITEVFVSQKYLDKVTVNKNDSAKVEFRWGPRADHEFSRRKSLEFVSQVYNGLPINTWSAQFKKLVAWEQLNSS